jgi:glycerol kinase
MAKVTFGTGCFMVLNTGEQLLQSSYQLLSTVAYRLKDKVTYALEGSTFSAGTIVKWMRDKLNIITKASEADTLAESLHDNGGVYMIPAFTGLGAPYWNPNVRAALVGMSSDTGRAQIARAGLEAVCYQAKDLFECAKQDGMKELHALRVDGGMAVSNWLLHFLASLLETQVERPKLIESTALGAMLLAGLQCGLFQSLEEIEMHWQSDKVFVPAFEKTRYQENYATWRHYMNLLQDKGEL